MPTTPRLWQDRMGGVYAEAPPIQMNPTTLSPVPAPPPCSIR